MASVLSSKHLESLLCNIRETVRTTDTRYRYPHVVSFFLCNTLFVEEYSILTYRFYLIIPLCYLSFFLYSVTVIFFFHFHLSPVFPSFLFFYIYSLCFFGFLLFLFLLFSPFLHYKKNYFYVFSLLLETRKRER